MSRPRKAVPELEQLRAAYAESCQELKAAREALRRERLERWGLRPPDATPLEGVIAAALGAPGAADVVVRCRVVRLADVAGAVVRAATTVR